ncbi:glycosyl hydrolase family 8 [Fulvimarina sp. MAC3]|uniref:glycosyl hydrolase family 8 n=1 Tax=Fulvimarina sp. MAC3 TaxID=3148887 RepID=UPI0031FCFDC9
MTKTFIVACTAALLMCSKGSSFAVTADQEEAKFIAEDAVPGDLALGAWQYYRSVFMSADGRIIDRENGSISHSEGQGYGMLIAASVGDRASFDKLWDWTERELQIREDSLTAWKWDPSAAPHVTDRNNATDGDLLIAWALLRAFDRWGVPDHKREAKAIIDDIVRFTVVANDKGRIILPGAQGFDAGSQPDGPVVNLSYWVFPALSEIGNHFPAFGALKLEESGLRLLIEATRSAPHLPTEWSGLGKGSVQPAEEFDPYFGYNALRIPLYLAWSDLDAANVLKSIDAAWSGENENGLAVVDVTTDTPIEPISGAGYRAIHELAACSLSSSTLNMERSSFDASTYYGSTLHLLSMLAISERYPQCF